MDCARPRTGRRAGAPCALLLALVVGPAGGAPLHLERLSPEDGLPHNTVNAILEDRQGFVWLGTDDGLARFDAYEFEAFRFDLVLAATTSNRVTALAEERNGRLWVGTDRGLHYFDRDRGRLAEGGDTGLAGSHVSTLFEDRQGRMWAGGADLFVRRGTGRFEAVATPKGPWNAPDSVGRIAETPEGSLLALRTSLVARRSLLLRADAGSGRAEVVPVDGPLPATLCLLPEPDGRLRLDPWTVIDLSRGTLERAGPRPEPAPIPTACGQGPDGLTWFASDRGIYRRDPRTGRVTHLRPAAGDTHWQRNYITTLQGGRGGGLWLGSLGGLYHADPLARRFEWLGNSPGAARTLGADSVSSIAAGRDGEIWVGTFGGGLSRLGVGQELRTYRHDAARSGSLCDDDVWALSARQHELWVGTDSGLCWRDAAGTFRRRAVHSLSGVRVKTLDFDETGALWLGTDLGLWRLRPRESEAVLLAPRLERPLQAQNVNCVLVEDHRRIWVGTSGGDLLRIDGATGEARRFPLRTTQGDLVPNVGLYDLHRDASGSIWLASGSGLGRFSPASGAFELPIAAGELPGSIVYAIEEDAGGRLWLGTGRGLVRFDARLPPGRRSRVFDLSDGVGNLEFNRHASLALAGRLYFGGITGLTLFRPDEIRENPHVPPVVLTHLGLLGDAGERVLRPPLAGLLELGPGDQVLTFGFVALNYTQPARNRYRYLLEGFDPGWVESFSRTARYTRLPPGRYRFRVQGSNNDGLWNETGASLNVRVRPPFWRTWWFASLAGLALAGLGLAGHRLRLRRLVALERMRLRIAADLHDELGSELPGIALASSLVGQQGELGQRDRQRLAEIRETALRLMQGLRDVVWHLSPEHDSATSMLQRMRATAGTLLVGVEHAFEADVEEHALDMERRRELFLAFKEMLANVVRHAAARRVTIRLALRRRQLLLEVRDDGRGFDPAASPRGLGLASLRRRAARLGAVLDLDSAPGRGTRVALRRQAGGGGAP